MFGYYFHRYIKDVVTFTMKALFALVALVMVLTTFYTLDRQEQQLEAAAVVAVQLEKQLEGIRADVQKLSAEKASLEEQLQTATKALAAEQAKSAELQQTLAKAILPESTWREVGERRIVEPATTSYERFKGYVKGLF